MPNDDDMKKPKIRFDSKIDKAMAHSYGEQLVNELHTLLSNISFYEAIEALKSKYNIVPNPAIDDDYTDMHIAEAVHATLEGTTQPEDENERVQYFIDATLTFNRDLQEVLENNDIDLSWRRLIKMYIAKGKVTPLSSIHGIIQTEMDQTTKELVVIISPEARREDIEAALPVIHAARKQFLPKRPKYQPSYNAKRDAAITRYKATHSYKETAKEFGFTDEDSVKKIVRRQKEKLEQLKTGTALSPKTSSSKR